MESVLNWSVIISIIGVLVVLTNIVVQVLKKVTWDKLPTKWCGIWCLPRWSSRSWWLMRQCSDLTS